MDTTTLIRFAVSLALGAVAFAAVYRLGLSAGAAEPAETPLDRRAAARRRLRILTGAASAVALAVTVAIASIVPTSSSASGDAAAGDDAAADDATAVADTTVDEASLDEALPALEQRADVAPQEDDGFAAPSQAPSQGFGDEGVGSGGS